MLSKKQLDDLAKNIRAGMDEAQANVYRSQGALELLAHLATLIDAEAGEEPAPAIEPEA